jgi:hypothetical protein
LKKYRAAIPKELRIKLSYTRALAFLHKRTGDTSLHAKIKDLRRKNRAELVELRANSLANSLKERYSSGTSASAFWSKIRKNFRTSNVLEAFMDQNDRIIKDTDSMLEMAASHYENLFAATEVYRPHPYVDVPEILWDNYDEKIPPIKMPELIKAIAKVKKKHSSDAYGISPFMLQYLPHNYLVPLLKIFNES